MDGIVTRNKPELSWEEFERSFYEVKDVTGHASPPVATAVNMVSCFADNATARGDPSLVPVDDEGRPATRDRPYFDWSYVCPTRDSYREGLLEMVSECVDASPDLRLDDVGFPRAEYCHCDACQDRFAASAHDDTYAWRADLITDFLESVAERVPGRLYLTVYPDPYPGHLYERSGVDLDALQHIVDEFVVPLYDTAYGTTYWIESLASGFADRLDAALGVELYGVNVDLDALIHAVEVADAYADHVYVGYDASNARAAIRRMRAEDGDGVTHGEG